MIGNTAPTVSYVNYVVTSYSAMEVKLLLANGTGNEVQEVLVGTLLNKGGYLTRVKWSQVEITLDSQGGTIVATGIKSVGNEAAGQTYVLTVAYTHDQLDNTLPLRHHRAAEIVAAFQVGRPDSDSPWLAPEVRERLSETNDTCTIDGISRLMDRRQN